MLECGSERRHRCFLSSLVQLHVISASLLLAFGPTRSWGDVQSCANHILETNLYDHVNDPTKLGLYADCVGLLRHGLTPDVAPKQLIVGGQHFSTLLTTHHREPAIVPDSLRDGGPETAEIPHHFVLPAFDLNIGHVIKMVGTHNPHQSYHMQQLLRPGDAFVDAGANLGAYTIPMAGRLGVNGLVFAFEPFLHVFQTLTANVALNGLVNVRTIQAALGETSRRMSLGRPAMHTFNTLSAMKVADQVSSDTAAGMGIFYDGTEEIQVWRLDDVFPLPGAQRADRDADGSPAIAGVQLGARPLRLIKIDVEGMETAVVRGAFGVIRQYLPLIWAENVAYFDSQGKDTTFLLAMHEVGYACSKIDTAHQDLLCSSTSGAGHQP